MTAQIMQTVSLKYQNPVSPPDADNLHALTLMQHRTLINVVRYTLVSYARPWPSSTNPEQCLELYAREVLSVRRGASTCVLPRKALVQYPRRAGLLARQLHIT
jgi:hypothetical protein